MEEAGGELESGRGWVIVLRIVEFGFRRVRWKESERELKEAGRR